MNAPAMPGAVPPDGSVDAAAPTQAPLSAVEPEPGWRAAVRRAALVAARHADAVNRAKACFRAQARAKPGSVPPAGLRLAEAVGLLQMMQASLAVALDAARAAHLAKLGACQADVPLSALLGFASDMNTLRTSTSSTALLVVQEVLMICGMAGYKNGTEYSVGRHLRDRHSAPLMINNDRIAQNTASLLLAQRPAAPGRA